MWAEDPRVNVDLTTSYVGPQVAGRTVLLQVLAESRQFAGWSQDQIVKLLSVPRLDRPRDDPERLSAVQQARGIGSATTFIGPWGKTKSGSLRCGQKEPESPPSAADFLRRLSHLLASAGSMWSQTKQKCREMKR